MTFWEQLVIPGGVLGSSCGYLGLGIILESSWGRLGGILGRLGGVLGGFWDHLGGFRAVLGGLGGPELPSV